MLEDDRAFFPKYDAVVLMRAAVDPAPLARLANSIDAATMIAMNAEVELDGRSFAETAQKFLAGGFAGTDWRCGVRRRATPRAAPARGAKASLVERIFAADFGRLAAQHLLLVFGSLILAIALGVPLGIAAWRWPKARAVPARCGRDPADDSVAGAARLPDRAVGSIGVVPAVIALFLYALLPIVRNTHAGLQSVSGEMAQAALSLGMTTRQALGYVQLPLAMPTLVAGIKTAAVINVGTATMAAFIGAGGFGERIVAGLAVNDSDVMLAGALPAAALALLVQLGFDLAERWARPRTAALARRSRRRRRVRRCDNCACSLTGWFPLFSSFWLFVTFWIALRRPPVDAGSERQAREMRDEVARSAQGTRQELGATLAHFQQTLLAQQGDIARTQNEQIDSFSRQLAAMQQHLAESLATATRAQGEQADRVRESLDQRMGEVRTTVETKLAAIQQDNEKKLEGIRVTVDEKLHATLEQRLGESFRQVAERLEQVHRGIGEMQKLASDVGSLSRIMSNVKTRGTFGEVQLGALARAGVRAGAIRQERRDHSGQQPARRLRDQVPRPWRRRAGLAADRLQVPARGLRAPGRGA